MEKTADSSTKTQSLEASWLENSSPHTKFTVYEASHIGRLSKFSSLCRDESLHTLYEKSFWAPYKTNVTWTLKVALNCDANTGINSLLMKLSFKSSKYLDDVRAKYRLIIYDNTMKEAKVISKSNFFTKNSDCVSEVMCTINDIVAADKIILSKDVLTVGCQVKFFRSIKNLEVQNWETEIMDSKLHCYKILEIMFKKQKFSDVKINISGRTFEAHKAILAAASPVFSAMFECNMTEAEQNYINIDDVDEETFEEMLRFIYTGNVNNIENIAYTLFTAADKYDIDDLKNICQRELGKSLTADNAVRILILADQHSAAELKNKVIEFIMVERVDVTKTEDFKALIGSHHGLLAEVIRALTIQ